MNKESTISDYIKELQEVYTGKRLCQYYFSYLGGKYKEEDVPDDFQLFRNIISYHMTPKNTWKPFEPYLTLRGGRRSAIPDDLKEDDIQKFEESYSEIEDHELKSRVADTLWLKKREVQYAYDAVLSYIESAKTARLESWSYAIDRIERALRLSLSLGKGGIEYYQKVVEYIRAILENIDLEKEAYFPLRLLKLFLEVGYEDIKFCIATNEACVEYFEDKDIYKQNDYLELLATWYEKVKEKDKANECRSTIGENHVKGQELEKSAMGKVSCLMKAIEVFRKAGKKERVNELHAELLNVQKDIPQEMQSFELPPIDITQSVEASVSVISNKTKEEAFHVFAFITRPTDIKEAFDHVENQMQQFILTSLFGKSTVNKDGKTVAHSVPVIGSEKMKREDRIFPELVEHLGINWDLQVKGAIVPALERIMLEHDITEQDLEKFVTNNPLIRPGHELLFLDGILFGFQEKWHLAGKILAIEIEDSMRFLLEKRGVLTSNIKADFTQDERGVTYFFKNHSEDLIEIFGEDVFYELKALLVKDDNGNGFNLRNLAAHGLMTRNELYSAYVVYLWWMMFRLISIPTIKAMQVKEPETKAD